MNYTFCLAVGIPRRRAIERLRVSVDVGELAGVGVVLYRRLEVHPGTEGSILALKNVDGGEAVAIVGIQLKSKFVARCVTDIHVHAVARTRRARVGLAVEGIGFGFGNGAGFTHWVGPFLQTKHLTVTHLPICVAFCVVRAVCCRGVRPLFGVSVGGCVKA